MYLEPLENIWKEVWPKAPLQACRISATYPMVGRILPDSVETDTDFSARRFGTAFHVGVDR
jgi:hypothetical protein